MPYVAYQMHNIPEFPRQYGFDKEETKLISPEMDHKTQFPQYAYDRNILLGADPVSTLSPAPVNHNAVFSDNSKRDIESPSGPQVNQWAVRIFSDFNISDALLDAMQKRGIDPLQSLKPAVAQLMGKLANEYLIIAENMLMHKLELMNFCHEYGEPYPEHIFPGIFYPENLCPRGDTDIQLDSRGIIRQQMYMNKPIIKHSSLVETKQLSSCSSGRTRSHPSPVECSLQTLSPIEIARWPHASPVDAVRPHASPVDAVRPHASPVDAVRPHASPVDAVRPREQGDAVETTPISPEMEGRRNPSDSNYDGKPIVTVNKEAYAPVVSPISSNESIDAHLLSHHSSIIVRPTEAENFPKSSTPKSFIENDIYFASARSNWPPSEYASPSDVKRSLDADPYKNWHQLMSTPRKKEALSQGGCNQALNGNQKQWQNSCASTDWRHGAQMLPHPTAEPKFRDECCDERADDIQVQDFQSHQGQFKPTQEFYIAPEGSLARECLPPSNPNRLNFDDNLDPCRLPSSSSLPPARDGATTSTYPAMRYAVGVQHLVDTPMVYGMNAQEYLSSIQAKCVDPYSTQAISHPYPQMMCENLQDHNYIQLTHPMQNTLNDQLDSLAAPQLFMECKRGVDMEPKFCDQVSQLEQDGVVYELVKPDFDQWRRATTSKYLSNDPDEKRHCSPMKACSDPHEGVWKCGSPIQNRNSVGIYESFKGQRSSFLSIIRSQRSSTSSSQGVDSGYSLTNSCKSKSVKISGYHRGDSKTEYLHINEGETYAAVLDEVRSSYSNDSLNLHGENFQELSATRVADITAMTYPSCTTYSSNSSASMLEEEVLESSRRKLVFPVLCGEFYNHYENKICSDLKHSGLNLSFPADSPTVVAGIPQRLSTSSLPYELQVNFEIEDCLSYTEDLSESVFLSSQIIQEPSSCSDMFEKYNGTQSGDREQFDQASDILSGNIKATSRGQSLSSSSCKYSLANPAQEDSIGCSPTFSSSVNSCTLSSDSTRCGVFNLWNNETSSQSEVFTTPEKCSRETSSEDTVDFSPPLASSHGRYSSHCRSQNNEAKKLYGRALLRDGRFICETEGDSCLPSKAKRELGSDPEISVLLQRRARQAAPERRLSDIGSPAAKQDCFSKALETWQFHRMKQNRDSCVRNSPREIVFCSSQTAKKVKKPLNYDCNSAIDRFSISSLPEPNNIRQLNQQATCKLEKNKFLETLYCQRSTSGKWEKRNANACSGSEVKILSRLKPSLKSISSADVNDLQDDETSLLSMTLPVPRMFYKLTYAVPRTAASSDEIASTELSELELISSADDNSKPLVSDGSKAVYDNRNEASMLVRSCVGKVKALIRMFEAFQL